MVGLPELPPELIETVCHRLDALSIIRLTQVSRQLWTIFQQSSALQYKVQLEINGLQDGQSGSCSSAARLELLKAHQAAWTNFNCSSSIQSTMSMGGNYWELVGNVLGTYSLENGFSFNRIPSAIRQIPSERWSLAELNIKVNDFSMDLSQDLLLVVEVTSSRSTVVHLLSLSTGRPHPLARNPQLSRDVDEPRHSSSYQFQIRIYGEHIGLLTDAHDDTAGLMVWGWKTGVMKKDLSGDEITSFAFLDHRMLLISVYINFQPELRVLDIEGPKTAMSGYSSFRLPALNTDNWEISQVDMMIQTEPSPSWTTETRPNEPFTTCHSDRLFVISVRGFGWENGSESIFILCVRLSAFLNLMEHPPEGSIDRAIAWDQWGPINTRMLRIPLLPDPWICFVYGQRCVVQTSQTRCQILDFNPLTTRKRRQDEETVDKRRRIFECPVTTSAPFAVHSVDISDFPSAAVMLAEDGIVTVSVSTEKLFSFTRETSFYSYSRALLAAMSANKRRIAVLGSRSVGKSSLIIQYCQNEFVESYYPTIESTFAKTVNYKNIDYDCEIIDTAGQDEFSLLNSKHAIGIHGYVLVYSVSSRNSFDMIQIIYDKIIDFCGVTNIPCVVVGSKVDLEKSRQVKPEEGQKLAKSNDAAWVETSAKTNVNVGKVFELCLSEIEKRTPSNQTEPPASRCVVM
ncbi:F-box domain-containing protein [Favolaschia claudopus]|uniref:F-box domain-containing protein n=1 Tax=Favolaschia claudopus TaxID=2862362 RepID=A0AAW0E9F7_9AGAR